MRYRTAAILSIVLIGGMFGLRFVMEPGANHHIENGLTIPRYVGMLLLNSVPACTRNPKVGGSESLVW